MEYNPHCWVWFSFFLWWLHLITSTRRYTSINLTHQNKLKIKLRTTCQNFRPKVWKIACEFLFHRDVTVLANPACKEHALPVGVSGSGFSRGTSVEGDANALKRRLRSHVSERWLCATTGNTKATNLHALAESATPQRLAVIGLFFNSFSLISLGDLSPAKRQGGTSSTSASTRNSFVVQSCSLSVCCPIAFLVVLLPPGWSQSEAFVM